MVSVLDEPCPPLVIIDNNGGSCSYDNGERCNVCFDSIVKRRAHDIMKSMMALMVSLGYANRVVKG